MPPSVQIALEAIFWASTGLVAYTYLLYPCLMWALAKAFGRPRPPYRQDAPGPTVSLLIAAYNEAAVIEEKIKNSLELSYPEANLEILVGSDGSTDGTVEIVRRFERNPRVKVFDFPRRGKIWVINDLARQATGEILVFSDANTMYAPDAASRLVDAFQDPQIGCAGGLLRLKKKGDHVGASGEGFYWKYETFKKRQENAFLAVAGANGAIYAIRRELFIPLSPRAVNDDFTISMSVYLQGKRLALVEDACAYEWTAPNFRGEFHRHVRDSAGHFQALIELRGLFDPRLGMASFSFISHRVIRWLVPFFMICALLSTGALFGHLLYRILFLLQASTYLGALLVTPFVASGHKIGPFFVPYYFISVNAAILAGFWKFCARSQSSLWEPTERTGSPHAGVRT